MSIYPEGHSCRLVPHWFESSLSMTLLLSEHKESAQQERVLSEHKHSTVNRVLVAV